MPTVRTPTLEIGYEEWGDAAGPPVVLLHGFPDDAHAWSEVAPPMAARGCRVLAPYLRGYGPTRFLDAAAPRMAQQAAIGQDLLDFLDALGIERAALAGYDWGGRAACITAILAPARVRALVTIGGYNVQDTVAAPVPASALQERANWYQWYFNTERGRLGLEQNRREICRLLWRDWSPGWRFDAIERRLAERPRIEAPSVILHGRDDGVDPPARSETHPALFPAGTERRVIPDAGHFLPHEQPVAVVEALLALLARTTR